MILTDGQLDFFAQEIGMEASELKRRLQQLDRQFRACALRRDWMGCLAAIKAQNRLLLLCPIESEEELQEEDFCEATALLTAIKIACPKVYYRIIANMSSPVAG
jgi:hypothetical protein